MSYSLPALDADEVTALLGELRVPVLALLPDGYLAWANTAAEALLDTTVAALQGCRLVDLPMLSAHGLDAPDDGACYQIIAGGPGPWVSVQTLTVGRHATRLIALLPASPPKASVTSIAAVSTTRPGAEAPARVDPTSGLLDRATIAKALENEVSRSRRYANPLSVLAVRVAVPDLKTGSKADPKADPERANALGEFGRVLKEETRWADRIGRWDAWDLLLVLPETGADAALALIAKLEQRLATETAAVYGVTFGLAEWTKGDDVSLLASRAFQSLEKNRCA